MRRRLSAILIVCLLVPTWGREPVHAKHAMVVSQEAHATDAGLQVLRAGGNAVDAAVAVALALAVTHPAAGNLGGGGFLLARMADGRSTFFDFREMAPAKASRNMYLDEQGNLTRRSMDGALAAGVPGTVRGLALAHQRLGRAKWTDLVEPAVRLATDGYTLSYAEARSIQTAAKRLTADPESRRVLLRNGNPYQMGDKVTNPDLASTLRRIQRHGAKDFYEGETAHRFAAAMARLGGIITLADLQNYRAVERKPLTGRYKDYEIVTAPPPSSGGLGILQMAAMLEGSGYEQTGAGSADAIHYTAETMRRYYADRSEHLADPDFHQVPVTGLLSRRYVAERKASINPGRATPSGLVATPKEIPGESTETTHLSIVDAEGNAVAMTYTLNGSYGAGVMVPGLGFLLNNEMDDFAAKPGVPNMFQLIQGEANAIQPGKRPLSSMTPTIVVKDGRPYLVLGAPGGSRIITGVLQVMLNVLDFGMGLQDAVDAPRFHHQWMPDKLYVERGITPDTRAKLQQKGHALEQISGVALVEAILVQPGDLQGAFDGRADGKAAGY